MTAVVSVATQRGQAVARRLRSRLERAQAAAAQILPSWVPGMPRTTVVAVTAVAVLLVAGVALAAADRRGVVEPQTAVAAQTAGAAGVAMAAIANHDGGYALSYPVGWQASTSASRTEVLSPGRDVSVSVGLGSRGKLAATTDGFVALLRDGYRDVEVTARHRDRVAGRPALAVAGQATNPDGARLNWLATGVQRKGRDLLVVIFSDSAADPAAVLPPTQRIISSLQLLE
jgi:hypothetical protein